MAASLFRFLFQRVPGRVTGELIMFFARALTGVRPVWRGGLPTTATRVYFANHGSHGDFVLIWTTLPARLRHATRPVAGRDYWDKTALKRFIGTRVFNALLIDRKPAPGEAPAASPVDEMAVALRRGESLIIFPEGTRNTGEAPLLPFKSGLYHLGRQCPEVELIPVWIDNIRRVIPKGQWLPVPMVCSVNYGAPLAVGADEDKDTFLKRAEAAVLALRPEESIAP
jgi:1-acyl-sn-glycerol-3-phosphate acyltransferase